MKRNKNLIYDCDSDAEKGNRETEKYTKMIIRRLLKQIIKQRFIFEEKSRHTIYKINRGFKSIIPKS